MIDIIILSNAKNIELEGITRNCLLSLKNSEEIGAFNVLVFESNPKVNYKDFNTVNFKGTFNYNKIANLGIKQSENEYVCVCNNDLIFEKGWASSLLNAGYDSMSPKSPNHIPHFGFNNTHKGYKTDVHICGWCLFFKREVWNKIGGLDEDFEFWCADDSYGAQLKKHNIPHYLVATSLVIHLGQKTLKSLSASEIENLTTNQLEKFKSKYGDYIGRVIKKVEMPQKKKWFEKVMEVFKQN